MLFHRLLYARLSYNIAIFRVRVIYITTSKRLDMALYTTCRKKTILLLSKIGHFHSFAHFDKAIAKLRDKIHLD